MPLIQPFKNNEFGNDGGPTAKTYEPMIADFHKLVNSKLDAAPFINVKVLVLFSLLSNGLGGLLFIFGTPVGAYLLMCNLVLTIVPIWHGYLSNKVTSKKDFKALQTEFALYFALFGALMYFIGMKNLISSKQSKRKLVRPKTA